MRVKTPGWWRKRGWQAWLLLPFSLIYIVIVQLMKLVRWPRKASVPVICVGNASAGGAGKTPVAIALAKLLQEQDKKVAFVTRGYGGSVAGPQRVDAAKHTADEVGDEALLLAKAAPCYVAKNRYAGVEAAASDGAELVILDDGLQNRSVKKSLSLLVVDGGVGFGNGLPMPSGPLRDVLGVTLEAVDAAIIIGKDEAGVEKKIRSKPVLNATISSDAELDKHGNYVAFAGIGYPKKFYNTLKELGARVAATCDFADHHDYTEADVRALIDLAREHEAHLITTEKDAVRIPAQWRGQIASLPISLRFKQSKQLRELLERVS